MMTAVVTVVAGNFAEIAETASFAKTNSGSGTTKPRSRDRAMSRCAGLAAVALMLGACATSPTQAPPAPAPLVEQLPELMRKAQVATLAGDKDKARDLYRASAKVEPTSQLPWLKLAESYFEAGDYGNAILAAQEVLQRDSGESAAATVLALSGLRVSNTALSTLRQQNTVSPGVRADAEALSKSLREMLSESANASRSPKESPAAQTVKLRIRPGSPTSASPAPTPATKTLPVKPAAASGVATATSSSPFDSLK